MLISCWVLGDFRKVVEISFQALERDHKYGTARVALHKITSQWDFFLEGDEPQKILKFDIENTRSSDRKSFEQRERLLEEAWKKFCSQETAIKIQEEPKVVENINLKVRSQNLCFFIKRCFIYHSKEFLKTFQALKSSSKSF